jgi:isoquinoline 1-oxidoreductase alpha subunit
MLKMAKFELEINDTIYHLEVDGSKPLLWVLRDELNLTGTKYGCGIGQCGACTVHVNGTPLRSCSTPVSSLSGDKITTIEGIARNMDHPVLVAWEQENVPQCGYCQTGQIMSAAALISTNPDPSDGDIDKAMDGNFCRCGTYYRIRKAIFKAVNKAGDK